MLKEFKEFAMRGNVLDMAIGIILGAAFGRIVSSLVDDVLMPVLGLFTGKIDFSSLFVDLSGRGLASLTAAKQAGAATLNYGMFLNTVVNFLLVAFAIFVMVKQINRLKREQPAPAPAPSQRECPHCLMTVPIGASRCGHCTSALQPA